jgi:hypothetical protein
MFLLLRVSYGWHDIDDENDELVRPLIGRTGSTKKKNFSLKTE